MFYIFHYEKKIWIVYYLYINNQIDTRIHTHTHTKAFKHYIECWK